MHYLRIAVSQLRRITGKYRTPKAGCPDDGSVLAALSIGEFIIAKTRFGSETRLSTLEIAF